MGWLWKYCPACGEGMERPGPADYIIGSTKCKHCGNEEPIDTGERRYAVRDLLDNLVRVVPDPPR